MMSVSTLLQRLARYMSPYRGQVALLLFAMLVDTCFEIAFPLSLKFLVDEAIIPRNARLLALILGGLAMIGVLAAAAGFGRDLLYARIGATVLRDIRIRLFQHVQRLSMRFHARREVGDLMSRFTSDLATVENVLVTALPVTLLATGQLVLSLVFLFLLQWKLAALTTAGLVVSVVVARMLERRAAGANYRMKAMQGSAASRVQENLNAQQVIKAFGLQQLAVQTFRQLINDLMRASIRANTISYLVGRIPNVVVLLVGLFVVGYGSVLTFQGQMSVGDLIAFNGLFTPLVNSVSNLTSTLPQLLQAAAGLQRLEEVLDEPVRIADTPEAAPAAAFANRLSFEHVTFSYDGRQTHLENASFHVSQGWWAAFVGPSGSGKSTILNLVLRFYDPDQGALKLDELDLRHLQQNSWRDQLAVVFQESFLFNLTLRENIRLGRPGASDAEIVEAARQAGIHDFITGLTDGYETLAGERGSRLSGGQRQRVAIARALLRNPRILLLDEATSALDPPTEAALNETLTQVARGRTVLSVTHRLAPVVRADQIFVLDRGRIVEQGRHAELLARQGLYAQLWGKQSGLTLSADNDRAAVTPARLKMQPILQELDEKLLEALAPLFATEHYAEAQYVLQEGQHGNRFYLIVRGKVAVERQGPTGKLERVTVLADGDHFGEIALLRNIPRVASIRTLTPCVLLSLQRDSLFDLLAKAPQVRARLEQAVLERLPAQDLPHAGKVAPKAAHLLSATEPR